MHYDLIVIGMGLSGLMAAKTAAEAGGKLLIVGKGIGSLCLFSNTIDMLGQLPNGIKMKEGLSSWIKEHPNHPYSKVGLERVEQALSSFLSLFPPPYSFQTVGNKNCHLPTGAGTLRPTFLIPMTMVAGASFADENTVIVGFKGFKDFYAHYVAGQLKCRGVSLQLVDGSHQELSATALARLMESESFRVDIGRQIKKQLRGETHVGFPAILGMHHPIQVKDDLEEITGAKIFEIPTLPPSIPGKRTFDRFKQWLVQRGVTFLLGNSVSNAILKGRRCEGIEVLHPPVTNSYSADRYILATGRFISGGLKANEDKIFEPIFNLPLFQPESREGWFRNSFFSDLPHPIYRAGILTDSSFRPVDEQGDQVLENVWVAGTISAHHQAIAEKSKEGIEISTGYMAAKRALEK